MDYPLWIIPGVSGAMVIAMNAIFHVCISHFAVGMGLFVAVAELKAIKSGDPEYINFVKSSSKLILIISAIIGALTGVGIWFTIALVSPSGTSSLIHNFVWGWAIEWIFFVLEIVAILIYYYSWDKVSEKFHNFVAWLYFIGAYLSLVIINGIITFQLTPGKWIKTHAFWDGFFNPTYFPSLVGRTGICLFLAGVFATIVLSFVKKEETKAKAGRFTGVFLIIGIVLTYIGFYWWANSIPENVRAQFLGENTILSGFYKAGIWLGIISFAIGFVFTLLAPKKMNIVVALILLVLSQLAFGYYEFTRERARKPYVIRDYMYSNGILKSEVETLNEKGILSKVKWANPTNSQDPLVIGKAVFNAECIICHDPYHFNSKPLLENIQGSEAEDIASDILDSLEDNPLMPPFVGTDEEKMALAKYLEKLGKTQKY
jgi:cytochrome d ubiquinol oxidase subunit I